MLFGLLAGVCAEARGSAESIAPEPPSRLVTAKELLDVLQRQHLMERADACRQLSLLTASSLPTIKAAIESPYIDVRLAAMEALLRIGNHEAAAVLEGVFQDTTLDFGIRVPAAEALGDIRDTGSIRILEDAVQRSPNPSFRRFVGNAARRISEPEFDAPIFEFRERRMWFRFLREDAAWAQLGDRDAMLLRKFDSAECLHLLDLLSQSIEAGPSEAPTGSDSVFALSDEYELPLGVLEIALRDGRTAWIYVYRGDLFGCSYTSRYWRQRNVFTVSNPLLAAYLREQVAAKPQGAQE
jgi:hypothetical protein